MSGEAKARDASIDPQPGYFESYVEAARQCGSPRALRFAIADLNVTDMSPKQVSDLLCRIRTHLLREVRS